MEKKPRVKKNKLDSKKYLEDHPDLLQQIEEINKKYSEALGQIFKDNKEVDANVIINLELVLKQ